MKIDRLFAVTLVVLLSSCSASKQAFKEAQEFEEKGLYVEAVQADLRALDKDTNFSDAKVHLRGVAPKAYDELLSQARHLEDAENWEMTVDTYERMASMLKRCNSHAVVFQTINVKETLDKTRQKAAQDYYQKAERLFADRNWGQAANAYLNAHRFVRDYNLSLEKAIESLFKDGQLHLDAGRYEQSLLAFGKVLEIAPNHPAGKEKMAETHYLLGKQYFEEGRFREALAAFEEAETFVPEFRDVKEWADRAYDEAVQYLAVFPFLNNSEFSVDGYLIAAQIQDRLMHANLEYARFLSHPEAVSLAGASRLERYGRVSESELLALAQEEGLDAVIWGVVRDVDVDDSPEKMQEIAHDRVVTAKDSSGKEVEEKETIYYREYTRKRRVTLRVESMILQTATGALLDRQQYRQEITDVATWIGYSGSIYDLPKDKRGFLDAPRNPREVGLLISDLMARVSERISRDVIQFLR